MIKFICSYQGATDVKIGDREYQVRYAAFDSHPFRPEHFECVLAEVGTVRTRSGFNEFPSDSIMKLFPGFVPAKWCVETNQIVYPKGMTPATHRESYGLVADAPHPGY